MPVFPAICKFTGFSYPMRGKSLSFYRGKIQKISEITNFFRHYFLSRTEVNYIELLSILLQKYNPVVTKTDIGGEKMKRED